MQKGSLLCLVWLCAATSVHAQKVSLTDSELREHVGQAGLTVEVQGETTTDEVEWQDTGATFLVGGSAAGATPDETASSSSMSFGGNSVDTSQLNQNFSSLYQNGNDPLSSFSGEFNFNLQGTEQQSIQPATQLNTGNLMPQQQMNADQFGMYSATGAAIFMAEFNMNVYSLGSVIVDQSHESTTLDAYFTAASNQLKNLSQAIHRDLLVHDSRGLEQPEGIYEGLAHLNLTFSPTVNSDGHTALSLDIHRFAADIDMTNINVGDGGTIGSIYLTDISGTSSLVVYAH